METNGSIYFRTCRLLASFLVVLLGCSLAIGQTYTPGQKVAGGHGFAKSFLNEHCFDCHSGSAPEGNLSLDDLRKVDAINAATWESVWAQVALGEMPPKDMDRPAVVQRLQFADWVVGELTQEMRDKGGFRAHLDPGKGNFLNHDLLFRALPGGIKLTPTSSPARIWRVTREEHITRLNELINREPEFDPSQPGRRTHGDAVPTNHGGELKLYFGTDRIIAWQGGTVAYATAVKSLPAILSSNRTHGLENYPDLYSVNSAEATQIMSAAEDILRYMAYGPHSIAEPYQFSDDRKSLASIIKKGGASDIRGLPTSIVYSTKVARPLTPVYDLMKAEGVDDDQLRSAVDYLFEALTFRPPATQESEEYLEIVKQSIEKLGKEDGTILGLASIFLDPNALFRSELVEFGKPDSYGRVMLQDWELGLAVNHSLQYLRPDEQLRQAIVDGKMRTRADVKREVERMLADDSIRKPRILQFFRDYFDYDLAGYICKDAKSLAATGASTRGVSHYRAMFDATASTDRLVELILEEDRDVLKELLTTDRVVASKVDSIYFGRLRTREERAAAVAKAKQMKKNTAKEEAAAMALAEQELSELETFLAENPDQRRNKRQELAAKKKAVSVARKNLNQVEQKRRGRNFNPNVAAVNLEGNQIFARVSRRSFGNGSMKPERVLSTVPQDQRLGILTHPSWLVSHSDAMDNHAIRRGKWIRERLLGGGVPDVPITVDAMLPDEPKHTLRDRMRVTKEDYCWTCHQKMDPLGLPFEMYNHAGIFRTTELDQPVDTSGEIIDSGDPALDGRVANAFEMIQKLADSERVEQVFVRHAFRFWMGRNETLNDAPVLQAAHRAYRESGGSMNALITSLLTSDAFLYRKVDQREDAAKR